MEENIEELEKDNKKKYDSNCINQGFKVTIFDTSFVPQENFSIYTLNAKDLTNPDKEETGLSQIADVLKNDPHTGFYCLQQIDDSTQSSFTKLLAEYPNFEYLEVQSDSENKEISSILFYNKERFKLISEQEAKFGGISCMYTETDSSDMKTADKIAANIDSLSCIVKKPIKQGAYTYEYYLYVKCNNGEIKQKLTVKESNCLKDKIVGKSFVCSRNQNSMFYEKIITIYSPTFKELIRTIYSPNPQKLNGVPYLPLSKESNQYGAYGWYFRSEYTEKVFFISNLNYKNISENNDISFISLNNEENIQIIFSNFNTNIFSKNLPQAVGYSDDSGSVIFVGENHENALPTYFLIESVKNEKYIKNNKEHDMYEITPYDDTKKCMHFIASQNQYGNCCVKIYSFEKQNFLAEFKKVYKNFQLHPDEISNLKKWYMFLSTDTGMDTDSNVSLVYASLSKLKFKYNFSNSQLIVKLKFIDIEKFFKESKPQDIANNLYITISGKNDLEKNWNNWCDYIKSCDYVKTFRSPILFAIRFMPSGYRPSGEHLARVINEMDFDLYFKDPKIYQYKDGSYVYHKYFIAASLRFYPHSKSFKNLDEEEKKKYQSQYDDFLNNEKLTDYHIYIANVYLNYLFQKHFIEKICAYNSALSPLVQLNSSGNALVELLRDIREQYYKSLPFSMMQNSSFSKDFVIFAHKKINNMDDNILKWCDYIEKKGSLILCYIQNLCQEGNNLTTEHVFNVFQNEIFFEECFVDGFFKEGASYNECSELYEKEIYFYSTKFIMEALYFYATNLNSSKKEKKEYNIEYQKIKNGHVIMNPKPSEITEEQKLLLEKYRLITEKYFEHLLRKYLLQELILCNSSKDRLLKNEELTLVSLANNLRKLVPGYIEPMSADEQQKLKKWCIYFNVKKNKEIFNVFDLYKIITDLLKEKDYDNVNIGHLAGAFLEVNFEDYFEVVKNGYDTVYTYKSKFIELSMDFYMKTESFNNLTENEKANVFNEVILFSETKKITDWHINLAKNYLYELFKKSFIAQIQKTATSAFYYSLPSMSGILSSKYVEMICEFAKINYESIQNQQQSVSDFKGTLFSSAPNSTPAVQSPVKTQTPIKTNNNEENLKKWIKYNERNTSNCLYIINSCKENSSVVTAEHVVNVFRNMPFENYFEPQIENNRGFYYTKSFILESLKFYSENEKSLDEKNRYMTRYNMIMESERTDILPDDTLKADEYLVHLFKNNLQQEIKSNQSQHLLLFPENQKLSLKDFLNKIRDFNKENNSENFSKSISNFISNITRKF